MNTFSTFNILFYLRPDRKNIESQCPIYMRITVKGQRAEVSTKRYIERENWDSKPNRAKGFKNEVKQLNLYLESLRTLMNDYHTEMVKLGEEITAHSLKNKFLGISEDRRMLIEVACRFKTHLFDGCFLPESCLINKPVDLLVLPAFPLMVGKQPQVLVRGKLFKTIVFYMLQMKFCHCANAHLP